MRVRNSGSAVGAPLAVERAHLDVQLQRGQAGAVRRILQVRGRAPQHHDAVAHELVDHAAVARQHARRQVEVFGQHAHQHIGFHRLGDPREALDIGEHHGHAPRRAAGGGLREVGPRVVVEREGRTAGAAGRAVAQHLVVQRAQHGAVAAAVAREQPHELRQPAQRDVAAHHQQAGAAFGRAALAGQGVGHAQLLRRGEDAGRRP